MATPSPSAADEGTLNVIITSSFHEPEEDDDVRIHPVLTEGMTDACLGRSRFHAT
jgi:hypothetical protein